MFEFILSMFCKTELLDQYTAQANTSAYMPSIIVTADSNAVTQTTTGFHKTEFTWSSGATISGTTTPSGRVFKLRAGDIVFKNSELNLVVGPTGCGKTSLLLALLGEMHFNPPAVDSWFKLPREEGVAYCAQEPWLVNDTIKVCIGGYLRCYIFSNILLQANILFGSELDEARYQRGEYFLCHRTELNSDSRYCDDHCQYCTNAL